MAVLTFAVAAFFAGMGAMGLARPDRVVDRFGIALPTADGRTEVRAVYGGFGAMVALLLAVAEVGGGPWRAPVLLTVAASLVGMAAGRLISRVVEPPDGFYPSWTFFVVEVVLAGALGLRVALG